ncbi:AbrB/MazE/SpoVT family DNA-binding domain-containing protein [Niabella ginsengisoli]|uniref:SpoVT-AbrB domain-containing protein n=1 Tax=Niabella ginsengisoli TaxID=522298 RepID=A0ABS9SEX6_9BACT|nr:hypothetical protein [Niabella ginsengisoli]MCH5596911.1 hypothetical protein [Niabella ginsengisoli]
MIVKLRKIGNSNGILLSKNLLEQCSITEEVNIEVVNSTIILKPVEKLPREGWEQQLINAGASKENELLLGDFDNDFEKNEWTW